MGVDFQFLFNMAVGIGTVVGVPLIKMIFDRITAAQIKADNVLQQLNDYRLDAAERFLSIDRFNGFEERLFNELRAIKEKLDDKEDRR
jgi:hypothetical protein